MPSVWKIAVVFVAILRGRGGASTEGLRVSAAQEGVAVRRTAGKPAGDAAGRGRRGAGRRRATGIRAAGALALAALIALGAVQCGEDTIESPADTSTNTIVAYYQSPEVFVDGVIELDGERLDREWGSKFTPERPFTQVRLTAEEGAGSPGATRYVAMKAIYTNTHLYLLLQWPDGRADVLKDAFRFVGPGLADPVIHNCREEGGRTVCDTTFRHGPQDSLVSTAWWVKEGDDDKIALIFEVEPASTAGATFAERGCQTLCHPGAAQPFGTSDDGVLDVWYWMAGRTNPIRNIFNLADDPEDPTQGLPGYLDDWYSRPGAGLLPDPGWPAYMSNDPYERGVPEYVYRRGDDDFFEPDEGTPCENRFGGECLSNNGVSFNYIWREYPNDPVARFNPADTLNESSQPDARPWVTGDIVPGHWLTYPSDSRADVRGQGGHDEEIAVWTLEVARRLDTGDGVRDVRFRPGTGETYSFTIAVFDGSTRHHWGSEPQVLVFGEQER